MPSQKPWRGFSPFFFPQDFCAPKDPFWPQAVEFGQVQFDVAVSFSGQFVGLMDETDHVPLGLSPLRLLLGLEPRLWAEGFALSGQAHCWWRIEGQCWHVPQSADVPDMNQGFLYFNALLLRIGFLRRVWFNRPSSPLHSSNDTITSLAPLERSYNEQ